MRTLAIVVVLGACVGCTTITRGPFQDLPIRSNPSGAEIVMDGIARGVTPAVVPIQSNQTHFLTIQKDCFRAARVDLRRDFGFAMWAFGNLLFPIVGHVVDIATGAAWRNYPQQVDVSLEASPGPCGKDQQQ